MARSAASASAARIAAFSSSVSSGTFSASAFSAASSSASSATAAASSAALRSSSSFFAAAALVVPRFAPGLSDGELDAARFPDGDDRPVVVVGVDGAFEEEEAFLEGVAGVGEVVCCCFLEGDCAPPGAVARVPVVVAVVDLGGVPCVVAVVDGFCPAIVVVVVVVAGTVAEVDFGFGAGEEAVGVEGRFAVVVAVVDEVGGVEGFGTGVADFETEFDVVFAGGCFDVDDVVAVVVDDGRVAVVVVDDDDVVGALVPVVAVVDEEPVARVGCVLLLGWVGAAVLLVVLAVGVAVRRADAAVDDVLGVDMSCSEQIFKKQYCGSLCCVFFFLVKTLSFIFFQTNWELLMIRKLNTNSEENLRSRKAHSVRTERKIRTSHKNKINDTFI